MHGGGTDAEVYKRLAERLSAAGFAVHVYNRRGRGQSGERPSDYGLQTEVDDLESVLLATNRTGWWAIAAAASWRSRQRGRCRWHDSRCSTHGQCRRQLPDRVHARVRASHRRR